MTHYFCIATGMADCTPNDQQFHAAADEAEMREIIANECAEWEKSLPEPGETRGDEFFAYEFRMPREGEDNYSQRLRIAASEDWVLDVIGMTQADFEREDLS